jgi:hypothetical protein
MIRRSARSTADRPPRAGGRLAAEAARSPHGERSAGTAGGSTRVAPQSGRPSRGKATARRAARRAVPARNPMPSGGGFREGQTSRTGPQGKVPEARRRKALESRTKLQAGNGKRMKPFRVLRKEPHGTALVAAPSRGPYRMPARASGSQVTAAPEIAVAAAGLVRWWRAGCRSASGHDGRQGRSAGCQRRQAENRLVPGIRRDEVDASSPFRGRRPQARMSGPLGSVARIAGRARTTRTFGTVGPSSRMGETVTSRARR